VVATIAGVLSAGQDLETAIVIATCATSIVVGKLGTATVTRHELSAALSAEMREDGALVSIDRARPDRGMAASWRAHRLYQRLFRPDPSRPYLPDARGGAAGDKLVVALNSDTSVARLKGPARPLQDEQARATVIGALRDVDLVVIFDEDTPLETIRALRPDVIVKGSDYQEHEVVGGDIVKSYGGSVVLVDLVAGRSTTSIVRKMLPGESISTGP
jgi:D-beta-D-heptose 7-phosphate kinase/D-beta-D-heptose 1-phosphate adenosyltransferase